MLRVLKRTSSPGSIRLAARGLAAALLSACLFAMASISVALAAAPSGSLDPTFGTGGKVTTDFSGSGSIDGALAVAIQGDGKIVTAGFSGGDFALARYNTNGTLDASFGSGGKVTTDFGGNDAANALAIQADGKIVTAGSSFIVGGSQDFALARYGTNGALDAGFGTGGKVTTDFSGSVSNDVANGVAVQSDGKIVAAGYSNASLVTTFALARYDTNGTLDAGFGTGGKVITAVSGGYNQANAVAIQSDGKIVAAGYANSASADFALVRYETNGSLDTSFGTGGMVNTDFSGLGSEDLAWALVIRGNGEIVAGGTSNASSSYDFALAQYNSNGTLDTSFNSTGKITTDFSGSGSEDVAYGLAIQAKGKIVAAGYSAAPSCCDFALARYKANGTLDTSFNSTGKVTTDFSGSGSDDVAYDLAIQGNGRIVAAGSSNASGNYDFALARYRR